ncbi:MAG: UDP-N-acetylmuramoyl-L-alanine--D-glutamate ligase [Rhodospirillales bacterium]
MDFQGKNIAVVGMGQSGLAVVEFLLAQGAKVRAIDSKPLSELIEAGAVLARLGVPFEPQSAAALEGADAIVISPGVPADLPELEAARRRGTRVLGEVELTAGFLQGCTMGITGANGKTTTTALAGHILREAGIPVQVGGNIGTPVTAMIAGSRAEQWNVIELSSFQLETIECFRAEIGVCLNVTPDHLDRHHTFENYVNAKARLFETQTEGDFAVLNADDASCVEYGRRTRARKVWFSTKRAISPGLYADFERLYFDGAPFMTIADIPLRGRHNVENVLAAAGAAHMAGVPLEAIAAAVRTFPGVEHRIEYVRTLGGVDFYNDSKATNVDATVKSIEAFPGRLWIILGGKDKGSDYTVLQPLLREKARAALLIGAAAPKIAEHLGDSVRLIFAGTLEAAVREAWSEAQPDDTVLLAPACASFDQFDNYEHRGRVFKETVKRLEERKAS